MSLTCLGAIRSSYHKFSEKEKKIADYILEKPELVIHQAINEVANDLNIADATVFRFSKRIGFKGFQAMKIALASELLMQKRSDQEEPTTNDDEMTLTKKIFNSNIKILQNTLDMIDKHSLKKAIENIHMAKRVEFYGTGRSAVIAMDAAQKFMNAGLRAAAFPDPSFQLMSATHLTKDDVAIFISHSGSNKETMNILKAANAAGAKTIGITAFPKSPISLNVNIGLYTYADGTEYLPLEFASQVAQICLIDALCYHIFQQKSQRTS
ncbi:MurR/RpiR family transcriptional regulator [Bacillus sp. BRMEA1]|uniref:MurR/RpiR family transcriptional regulator n=1 Tax=Neobacillus endophyticus TaxID=2738405 RepID=UPI001563DB3E|nr:MurR/RpiR family transcriptional regulator [Neobacillus endophyticus]NRD79171.1 MurR/RpiR family transcriptional regulator [Neobacillus endophyticus]